MADSGFAFEEGDPIDVGIHGDSDYLFHDGDPVSNEGVSAIVFEDGVGIGRTGGFFEDFEDQSFSDNFSVVSGNWNIGTTFAYEGTYGVRASRTSSPLESILVSDRTVETYGLKFRYRVNVRDTGFADGDFLTGYQDDTNNFLLEVRPSDTDNPAFRLVRESGGTFTPLIGSTGADFVTTEWLTVRGEIQADGDAAFEVDHGGGTQRISGTMPDTSTFSSGKVALRGYDDTWYDLIEVNTAKSGTLPNVV